MLQLGRPPARPGHAVEFAVMRPANTTQGGLVEGVLMLHVRLHALGRLPGHADGPHATVPLAGDVLDQRFLAIDLDVAEHSVLKTEFFGEFVHDGVIRQ